MAERPSRRVIVAEVAALAAAVPFAIVEGAEARWDPALLAGLLAAAVIGDLTARDTTASRIKVSSSFLAIVTATVLLGAAPAAIIAVVTILAGWLRFRYPAPALLINLVTFAWFPLLAGALFHATVDATGVGQSDTPYYLAVFGLYVVALAINFAFVGGYVSYVDRGRLSDRVRRVLVPLLPTELVC